MPFTDTIARLPYRGRTALGTGFLAPMGRSLGHILHLDAGLAEAIEKDEVIPDDDVIGELQHALDHWHARQEPEALSTAAAVATDDIETALTEAIAEYPEWDAPTRIENLRQLTNRISQFWSDLDRETLGIRDSDPGTSM